VRVTHVSLHEYRNYHELVLPITANLVIFVGANAQGKTNLLEAIYYLATARSFRTANDQDLIGWQAEQAQAACRVERELGEADISIRLQRDKPKIITVNGQHLRRHGDLFGYLNVVTFTPDDLQLIKGSPAERRRFLDMELTQVSPTYRHDLAAYNRILKQRNNLLRTLAEQRGSADMLAVWDEQLIETGSRLMVKRAEAVLRLSELGRYVHHDLTNGKETLSIRYRPFFAKPQELAPEEGAWESLVRVQDRFRVEMRRLRAAEMGRGQSLVGPQRDDLEFLVNDYDVRSFGSQGQQRSAVLSCKLAEIEFMRSEISEYPVLLLDDVMSELDAQRRHYFLNMVNGLVHTFITTTAHQELSASFLKEAQVARIAAGRVLQAP
jgi:DNA replication and repair protein RecF